jgi:hypothetical protein
MVVVLPETLPQSRDVVKVTGINTACCLTDFTGTKRIIGRVTASHIALASAAPVFPRFT